MTVILVCPQAHYPGHYWRDTQTLANALAREGVSVEIVVAAPPLGGGRTPGPVHQSLPGAWTSTVKWYSDSKRPRLVSLMANLETMACALRTAILARRHPSAAIHFMGGTHLTLLLFTLLTRRAIFLSIYGDFLPSRHGPPGLKARVRDWLLSRVLQAHRLVLICETESIRARARPAFRDDVHVIPYAITVTPRSRSRTEIRASFGLPLDEPVFLLFGTQRQGKDYGVVLRAARLLPRPVHLLFVGKCISENNPRTLAATLDYPHATFIDRFVDDAEVPDFFFASDAAILPYDAGFDRGSGVILDSAAYGLPVLVSRTGYLQWFIDTHRSGLLFTPGDPAALAEAITQFLSLDPAALAQLEARVAETARLHSWPVVIQDYLRLYRQVLPILAAKNLAKAEGNVMFTKSKTSV